MTEQAKIIIEIYGGLVSAIYADKPAQIVIVDHDSASIAEQEVDYLQEFDGDDVKTYDRHGSTEWVW
jgi:hypothetical protein